MCSYSKQLFAIKLTVLKKKKDGTAIKVAHKRAAQNRKDF